ncbi:MAG: hypothetical protein J6S51_04820 [Kiritimatiellae bacterium]|nr:hypothetical protein [Kiritimatiellia bacterium]
MTRKYHTNFKCDSHSYTRSSEPWSVNLEEESYLAVSPEARHKWRLFHYLAGGGLKMCSRTLEQDARSRRQSRFLVFSAILITFWAIFLMF